MPKFHGDTISHFFLLLFSSLDRSLKSEFLKSKQNKKGKDVVAEEEPAPRPLLRPRRLKVVAVRAMIRPVPPYPCRRTIHPPVHHKNNNKSNEERATKIKQKSHNKTKRKQTVNKKCHLKNNPNTLQSIAKW